MEQLIIQLISGAVGGNVAGAAMKEKSLGTVGNSIAGIVGGVGGGQEGQRGHRDPVAGAQTEGQGGQMQGGGAARAGDGEARFLRSVWRGPRRHSWRQRR